MIDLPDRVYKALAEKSFGDLRNHNRLYPSSMSARLDDGKIVGSCNRAEFYRWYAAEKDSEPDPEGALIFAKGDAFHDMVVRMLRSIERQTKLRVITVEQSLWDPKYFLSGRSDAFLHDETTDTLFGTEIKSVGEGAIYSTVHTPKIDHILQSVVYLDQYNKNAKKCGLQEVAGWVILYVARSESWKLKSYAHGSPFKHMWQYYVTIENNGDIVYVNQKHETKSIEGGLNINNVYKRADELLDYISKNELPPRDFQYQYDEVTLKALADAGGLNKKDKETVDKWVNDGAEPGKLELDKGDYQCRYCSFKNTCYSNSPESFKTAQQPMHPFKKQTKLVIPTKPKEAIDGIF